MMVTMTKTTMRAKWVEKEDVEEEKKGDEGGDTESFYGDITIYKFGIVDF